MPLVNRAEFRILLALSIAVGCPASAGQSPTFHEFTGKVVHIADGDTLTVLDREDMQHKVRLHGIDAPEKSQAFGTKAKEALAEKVHEQMVRVIWKEKDQYGRIVGDVWLPAGLGNKPGERNINIEMVRDGWAWWYRQYAPRSRALDQAETEARQQRRGLWRDANPEPPWEFRKRQREKSREHEALERGETRP